MFDDFVYLFEEKHWVSRENVFEVEVFNSFLFLKEPKNNCILLSSVVNK